MPYRHCACGTRYFAKAADLKRGWGSSCSKRCAAVARTEREAKGNYRISEGTKRYRRFRTNKITRSGLAVADLAEKQRCNEEAEMVEGGGWDAHKIHHGYGFHDD